MYYGVNYPLYSYNPYQKYGTQTYAHFNPSQNYNLDSLGYNNSQSEILMEKFDTQYNKNHSSKDLIGEKSNLTFKGQQNQKEESSNTKNYLIAGGVVAAIAAGAFMIFSKGKFATSVRNFFTGGKAKPESPAPKPTTPPAAENLEAQIQKSINVSEMKAQGVSFDKGRAVLADGKGYTGEIVQNKADGIKIVRNYTDGKMWNVTKFEGDVKITERIYTYRDGRIDSIFEEFNAKSDSDVVSMVFSRRKVGPFEEVYLEDGSKLVKKNKITGETSVQDVPSGKVETPIRQNVAQQSEELINGRPVIKDPNPGVYEQSGVKGVQAVPRAFAPHSYKPEDVPAINIVTRTPDRDYRAWNVINGKTVSGKREYQEAFFGAGVSEGDRAALVIGKNKEGQKVVFLQAETGRQDFCGTGKAGRRIRALYTLTAPKGQDFTTVQKDLIKGLYGRDLEFITTELPLARSGKVINVFNRRNENMVFDLDIMLREVNHFAQGRTITEDLAKKLAMVDSFEPGKFIRLV